MLLEKIKADALEARKARDADRVALLTTLYADSARVGKDAGGRDTSDEETVRMVRKFLKGVDESLGLLTQPEALARAQREKAILEGYLPTPLTGEALKAVIEGIVSGLADRGPKQMGAVMGMLRTQIAGAYDGKEATALVREVLAT